ncbi:cell agglutination protein Mam3 [Diatrype stigma]|uniref:Cell agglutination protein Mam3 n=1 Tax=Diatrype stigma TaxID=117547 RepID=A0AAN9UIC6_9PEZI
MAMLLGIATAAPIQSREHGGDDPPVADGTTIWVLYVASIVLVLMGGAFAGLTIALMGQDEVYLQVVSLDPEEPQRKNAKRVHDLLIKGKHWLLVTLLLSNVIVNETLPVVLDRCFGGGVAAVVGSTVLIVIFGEVLPQSVCVRYGLQIGGYMSKPVLFLMYVMAPVAWPTAKLLDWMLGEDHGTVYKKSGLKTLVTLHKSLGAVDDRLNQDEVTIISAVLDLKRKPVEEVMTPMDDVFVMSEDTVLDQKTTDLILDAGYSRVPIHQTGNPTNFVGMLLVKILITYDPEDGKRVRDFPLATLPETRPETSCLDIINYFQEGKSHMTLEDVIEELIGEEIIDESDVYVDVHKAIRRAHPAPKARIQRDVLLTDAATKDGVLVDLIEGGDEQIQRVRKASLNTRTETPNLSSSPRTTSLLVRKGSAGQTVSVKANYDDIREHLKHLGPSNKASNPKSTRVSAVKIKPGMGHAADQRRSESVATGANSEELEGDADERTTLLRPRPSQEDGHQDYGSRTAKDAEPANGGDIVVKVDQERAKDGSTEETSPTDSVASNLSVPRRSRGHARSGSITENVVEQGGIRKVVLKLTSATGHEHDIQPAAETTSSTSQDNRAKESDDDEQNERKKKGGK